MFLFQFSHRLGRAGKPRRMIRAPEARHQTCYFARSGLRHMSHSYSRNYVSRLPSGPRIYGSFAVSFLSQVVLGKLAAPTARRGGGITILLQG